MSTWVLVCLESGISPYVESSLFPCQCVMHLGASNPLVVDLLGGYWVVSYGFRLAYRPPNSRGLHLGVGLRLLGSGRGLLGLRLVHGLPLP